MRNVYFNVEMFSRFYTTDIIMVCTLTNKTPFISLSFISLPIWVRYIYSCYFNIFRAYSRSQWPRGIRHRSAAACRLRLWVRIPPGTWMSVWCECCVWSGRGLCDELITRPKESYRLWCVVVCDLETSRINRPWPTGGFCVIKKLLL